MIGRKTLNDSAYVKACEAVPLKVYDYVSVYCRVDPKQSTGLRTPVLRSISRQLSMALSADDFMDG